MGGRGGEGTWETAGAGSGSIRSTGDMGKAVRSSKWKVVV